MRRRNIWIAIGAIVVLAGLAGVVDWPKGPGLHFGPLQRDLNLRLGLDLSGGTSLEYEADVSQVSAADRNSALAGVRDVIERRVNAFGVSEPVVQTSQVGSQYRVTVELAGVTDINDAIKLIGETPLLEFREVNGLPDTAAKAKADDVLKKVLTKGANFAALAKEYSDDTGSKNNGGDLGFVKRGQLVAEFEKAIFDELKVGQITPTPVKTEFGYHLIKKLDEKQVIEEGKTITEVRAAHILIMTESGAVAAQSFKATALTGKQLKRADVSFDPQTGAPQVSLQFDGEGTKLFGEITKRNIGKVLAIYLDGSPISMPQVNEEISGGQAVINGNFTLKTAKDLAQRLNAGALPVPIKLIGQQNIGASLGQESVERSLIAGVIGLVLVALFMIFTYRLPGLLAVIALGMYSALVLAIFKLWPVTLTLAGIAGYILSIGMAVDANILVFERTKEELRAGRPLISAIEEGFKRAWLSIRDSNVSSLITCLILIWFGSSLIKGFAVTLAIGILVSMFTAITVTRSLLLVVVSRWMSRHPFLFGVAKKELPNTTE
jgi:preprotein translocase subunit SecD